MKKLLNKKNKGFTLIELMIVVAIIGILAAIAIPNFIRYQLRSKTAEARTNIGGIKTSQEAFRASEDNYVDAVQNPGAVPGSVKTDWDTADLCATGCNRVNPANCTSFDCVGFAPSGQVYYNYDTATVLAGVGSIPELAVEAIGDLDGDTTNGSFCYATSNDPTSAVGGVACPIATTGGCDGTLPGEVVNCVPSQY